VRSLTQLEAQFLDRLRHTVEGGTSRFGRVFLTQISPQSPALQLGLETSDSSSLLYYNILIYGTHPVRYHLETGAAEAELSRGFWNKFFGALNLVEEKSGLKNHRLHLFYEIPYPDKSS